MGVATPSPTRHMDPDLDSGLATCSDLPSCSEVLCPVVVKTEVPTLKQHYYPEGGWGWIVVAVSFAVHVLNQGLHMSSGVLLPIIVRNYPHSTYGSSGITSHPYIYIYTIIVMVGPPKNAKKKKNVVALLVIQF